MTALRSLIVTRNDMPFTAEQRQILAALLGLEKQKRPVDVLAKHIKYVDHMPMFAAEPDMPSVLRVLYERLVWAQLDQRVSRALALWIGLVCQDEHYLSVLWAYTIRDWCKAHPDHVATLSDWLTTVIPDGLPCELETREVWDSQKRQDAPNGNALDMPENWL